MFYPPLARSFVLVLLCSSLGPASADAQGNEELSVLLIASAEPATTASRSWELALNPFPAGRDLPSGLRLGEANPVTLLLPPQSAATRPPAPSATGSRGSGVIFASLSDNRLVTRAVEDDRQARLSKPTRRSLDWSGYEARERRARDPLTDSMQTLEWPDLEGGSEPVVPAVTRTPDGKRSGLGLGSRF